MNNIIGEVFLGQFRVESFIASGGMGAVFRVWDLKRNVPLAMKVLHTDLADDPAMFKRFQREARALQRLAHPHIVPFYGLYQGGDFAFLLERYIDGPPLKDILRGRQAQPFPVSEALVYIKAISSALGYAHAKGVVHCDVKPGNIMVDRGGMIFITDFGIARHADSTVTTLASAGTPAYMAPEQISEDIVGPYTDVYALGVLLFEMLTGQRPFTGVESSTKNAGSTAAERIRHAHLHLPPPNPQVINPALSTGVSAVLLRSLSKIPGERFSSTMDFFNALCEAVSLSPQSVPDRVPGSGLGPLHSSPPPEQIQQVPSELMISGRDHGRRAGGARQKFSLIAAGSVVIIGLLLIGMLGLLPPRLVPIPTHPGVAATQTAEKLGELTLPPTQVKGIGENSPDAPTSVSESPQAPLPASPIPVTTKEPTSTLSPSPTALPPASDNPNGKIVFTCQIDRLTDRDQLCIINADGTGFRQLTNDLKHGHWYASFAPDGKSIVFSSNQSGNSEIYEMDLNGRQTRLTNDLGRLYAPEISPDGRHIVFTNKYSGTQAIWIMNRDGGYPHELYRHSAGECVDPVWSPDGQKILMACGSSPDNRQLFTINIDGSGLRQVISLDGIRGRSDWSPNGEVIATYVGVTWNREIYLLDVDGSNLRQLTNGGNNLAPSFSPDGHWITFTSYMDRYRDNNGCEIYLMRIDGSKMIRLTDNTYCDWQPRWGP